MKATRLLNLDYLRGCAAFAIMVYHFTLWGYGDPSVDTFIKKTGVYGVSIFYVLSGLTLFHVYSNNMKLDRGGLVDFFVKRAFRIMPLLWVVTFATMLVRSVWKGEIILILNLTGLFGLVAPDKYIATGVWSIGNELVFYLFFPLFMLLYRKHKIKLAILSVAILGFYCFYSFSILPSYDNIPQAWGSYVNPLNQIFLFLSGFMIGVFFGRKTYSNNLMFCFATVLLLAFVYFPVSGNALNLITGVTRMIFTSICILFCLTIYKIDYKLPKIIVKPFSLLGEVSYSMYLLHPIVWFAFERATDSNNYLNNLPVSIRFTICSIITLILSFLSYQYFERYFIKLGKALSIKLVPKPEINVAS